MKATQRLHDIGQSLWLDNMPFGFEPDRVAAIARKLLGRR